MHIATQTCPRMLAYKPPRIAMSLLVIATALHLALGQLIPPLPSSTVAAAVTTLTGFLVMLRAWWLFRKMQTAICPTANTSALITSDIYRFTRNPMYLGIVLMLVGVGIFSGSVFHYATTIVYFAIVDHTFCPYEEQKLRRDFRIEFSDYENRVRRWL